MRSDVDRAFCVETYISSKSLDQTRQLLVRKLGWDHRKARLAPNSGTINRWVNELRGDRLFRRKQGSGRPRSVRSEETLRQVEQSALDSPKRSVRQWAQCLGLKRTSLNTILRKDLRLHIYRNKQDTNSSEPDSRGQEQAVRMAQWFAEHPDVSDSVSGSLTKRTWGSSVPDKVLTMPLHAEKVTAWIVMRRAGGLIGPFFEDERDVVQTINAERYLKLKQPERTEMSRASVDVMHSSFCHSIWNTTISEFLTWYVYFRFYLRKPQCHFFPDTLY